jgi:hypothetical protein
VAPFNVAVNCARLTHGGGILGIAMAIEAGEAAILRTTPLSRNNFSGSNVRVEGAGGETDSQQLYKK